MLKSSPYHLGTAIMRFYGREEELHALRNYLQIVQTKSISQMVTVIGRRRVGKTTLILKAFENARNTVPVFYFFVERRTSEAELVASWLAEVCRTYDVEFPPAITTVAELVNYLMSLSRQRECVCIIDECQDFNLVAPRVWSQLQKVWDLKKEQSRLLLVMSGSILSAMEQIFGDNSQPLYGRPSGLIDVKPFTPAVIKEIVHTENPAATNADLLAVYSLTGGVAQYLSLLAESDRLNTEGMLDYVFSVAGAWLRYEGDIYLSNEFRAEAQTYFEILRAIANGATKWAEIEDRVNAASQLAPYLSRLERFGIIRRIKPLFNEDDKKKNTKYAICDQYFLFWLTFITPADPRRLIEAGNWEGAKNYCRANLSQFLGRSLERWFLSSYLANAQWESVGGWWDKQGINEIDVVAVSRSAQKIEIAEVKLNSKKYDEVKVRMKAEAFLQANKSLQNFDLSIRGLSADDM